MPHLPAYLLSSPPPSCPTCSGISSSASYVIPDLLGHLLSPRRTPGSLSRNFVAGAHLRDLRDVRIGVEIGNPVIKRLKHSYLVSFLYIRAKNLNYGKTILSHLHQRYLLRSLPGRRGLQSNHIHPIACVWPNFRGGNRSLLYNEQPHSYNSLRSQGEYRETFPGVEEDVFYVVC